MNDFRKLRIWNESIQLTLRAYDLTNHFPKQEEYGLKSQARRASVSIPSNIAEGCSRSSQRDYKRFLEISLGSSFELETQFIIAEALQFIPSNEFNSFISMLHPIQRSINSLTQKIKRDEGLQ